MLTTEIPTGNLASDVENKDEIEAELHHMRNCGWKLARRPVRKVLTDKWGKKGGNIFDIYFRIHLMIECE